MRGFIVFQLLRKAFLSPKLEDYCSLQPGNTEDSCCSQTPKGLPGTGSLMGCCWCLPRAVIYCPPLMNARPTTERNRPPHHFSLHHLKRVSAPLLFYSNSCFSAGTDGPGYLGKSRAWTRSQTNWSPGQVPKPQTWQGQDKEPLTTTWVKARTFFSENM